MVYSGYLDFDHKPGKEELVCQFRIKPVAGMSVRKAAEAVASESSVGTWTEVSTSKEYVKRLAAKVFCIRGNQVKISYPSVLFENGNIPQILSSVAGNIFGMKTVSGLRLEDINLPDSIIRSFRGPSFGIRGVRRLTGVSKRPLVGTIVKPKIGLRTADHARVAFDAWEGGCDIVKDDENLTSQRFNPFKKRVVKTLKARDRAEKKTGERKMYMPNITGGTKQMLERAQIVKEHGGEYVMLDIITSGWSALQTLREADMGLVIHAHRAMHAAMTRDPSHGISMLVIAKLARLIGVDQIHIGTIIGKMEGKRMEVEEIEQQIEKGIIKPGYDTHSLGEEWGKIKPVFAVSSGGLHPGHVPKLIKMLGKDIIIQMGGGIHGHPKGTQKGAMAARQAVEASMEGISLKKYSETHKELDMALDMWNK